MEADGVADRVDVRLPEILAFALHVEVFVGSFVEAAEAVDERVRVTVGVPDPLAVVVRVCVIELLDVVVDVVVREPVIVRVDVGDVVAVRVGRIVAVPRPELVGERVSLVVAVGVREIGAVFVDVAVEDGERVEVVVRDELVVAVVVRVLVTLFVTIAEDEGVRVPGTERVAVREGRVLFVAKAVVVDSFE